MLWKVAAGADHTRGDWGRRLHSLARLVRGHQGELGPDHADN